MPHPDLEIPTRTLKRRVSNSRACKWRSINPIPSCFFFQGTCRHKAHGEADPGAVLFGHAPDPSEEHQRHRPPLQSDSRHDPPFRKNRILHGPRESSRICQPAVFCLSGFLLQNLPSWSPLLTSVPGFKLLLFEISPVPSNRTFRVFCLL